MTALPLLAPPPSGKRPGLGSARGGDHRRDPFVAGGEVVVARETDAAGCRHARCLAHRIPFWLCRADHPDKRGLQALPSPACTR